MNDSPEPVDLSPSRAELIARVRARGRQIRTRRRLGAAGIAVVVAFGIAAPAIAIGTRSDSKSAPPATASRANGDFRVALVAGASAPPCQAGSRLVTAATAACVSLGRVIVTAREVLSAAVGYDGAVGGWLVTVELDPAANRQLAEVVGAQVAIVVGGRVLSVPRVTHAITRTGLRVNPDGLSRVDAIALATKITGLPPSHVDGEPALSSHIELPGSEFRAGQEIHGVLVVDNNRGNKVTLARDANGCSIKWGVVVTNAQIPVNSSFESSCLNTDTVLEPGENRLPFRLSTDYSDCTQTANPPPGALRCLPAPHVMPPLPIGTYNVVLVSETRLFPTPPPLTITLVGQQTTPLSLGPLALQSGARTTKLLVPAGWTLKIEDGGGSGSASTWTNPDDPHEHVSGITGVEIGSWWETDGVKGSITPLVAASGTQVQRVNYTTFLFHMDSSAGYPIDGVWIALVDANGPIAFVSASVQLPSALHSTATSILNRFISDTNARVPPFPGPPSP